MAKDYKLTYNKIRGSRLDAFLAQEIEDLSRTQIKELIEDRQVFVNGKPEKPSDLLKRGDEIEVHVEPKKEVEATPNKDIEYKKIEAKRDFIVVEKPADITTHPNPTKQEPSLIEGVMADYPEIQKIGEDKLRPGVIHRLDRGTSGLLVIARTKKGFASLKKQFKSRTPEKEYVALVYGKFKDKEGVIDLPIVRSKHNPTMFMAKRRDELTPKNSKGKIREAYTEYEVEKEYQNFSLIRVKIKTGRTHQIRVHMKAVEHPVVGDETYTTKEAQRAKVPFKLHRNFLHAAKLVFTVPGTKKRISFESPLPKTLKEFLKRLEK